MRGGHAKNPAMQTALLVPGQGSQRVGMGRDLAREHAVARRTFEEADAALGFAISTLCFDGPEDDLVLTKHTQPAILTNSVAVFRTLLERGLTIDIVAGHSLGEWSALVAAGSLSACRRGPSRPPARHVHAGGRCRSARARWRR